jgi:hypothetical protein
VKVLAEKLSEIVELTADNWLIIWAVFGMFLVADFIDLITESNTMLLAATSIIACYLSCAAILMFQDKAHHIRVHLVHPLHLKEGHSIRVKADKVRSSMNGVINTKLMAGKWMRNSGVGSTNNIDTNPINQPLLNPGLETKVAISSATDIAPPASPKRTRRRSVKEQLMIQAGIVDVTLHADDHQPLYRYHFDGTERKEPEKWSCCCGLFKHQPDFHSALFWGGENGVEIFYGYIRTQMVLVALYLGTFVVIFGPAVFKWFDEYSEKHSDGEVKSNVHTWGPILVIFVALFPLAFMLYELSELIPVVVRITTTEEMIDDEAIGGVLRIMKSRKF